MTTKRSSVSEPFPPVIDVGALLRPIAREDSAAEWGHEEYSYSIDLLREEVRDLRTRKNWQLIINKTSEALSEKVKDLKLGVWLTEALVRVHGMVGLRDSIRLLHGLHEQYWDQLYPAVGSNGEMTLRFQALELLDMPGQGALSAVKALLDGVGNDGAALPPELLAECARDCESLHQLMKDLYGQDNAPEQISELLKLLELNGKPASLADTENQTTASEDAKPEGAAGGAALKAASRSAGGAAAAPVRIRTRTEALQRLRDVDEYFSRTEPLSPVTYMIRRAVSWAEMNNLEEWLKEVVKNGQVMKDLQYVLGFRGEPPEGNDQG